MLRLQAFPPHFVTVKHYGIYYFSFHDAGCLVQFWQILSRSCVLFLLCPYVEFSLPLRKFLTWFCLPLVMGTEISQYSWEFCDSNKWLMWAKLKSGRSVIGWRTATKDLKESVERWQKRRLAVLVSVEVAFFGHGVLVWMIGFRVYPALYNEAEGIQLLI